MANKVYRVVVECHINVMASSKQHAKEVAEVDARYAMAYTRYTNPETRIVELHNYTRPSFLAKKAEQIEPVDSVANV